MLNKVTQSYNVPLLLVLAASVLAMTAAELRPIEDQSYVKLTTIGRRSHEPRTVTIWFVHDQGKIYVQAGKDGRAQWYRNLSKNPDVKLDLGKVVLRGKARPIEDAAEVERVHQLFRAKYWLAWMSGWVGAGIGRGKVVVVESLEAATSPPAVIKDQGA